MFLMSDANIVIRPFAAGDQFAARTLILAGLGEHFGAIDESRNPDLDDITATYLVPGQAFVVAEAQGKIVGTGALIKEQEQVGRLVRMSVASAQRRQGIGRALVAHLVSLAREHGYSRLVLETNEGWDNAVGLYQACGFSEVVQTDGLVHMVRDLRKSAGG